MLGINWKGFHIKRFKKRRRIG